MKDFNDFLENALTQENVLQIVEDMNMKMAQIRQDGGGEANFNNQLGIMAITAAIEIVGLYHRWITDDKT